MTNRLLKLVLLFTIIVGIHIYPQIVSAEDATEPAPVVKAVIFYSPSCGHCQKVITDDLPPLFEKYGEQLQIIGINVSTEEGSELYRTYIDTRNIPDDRRGVPALIVNDLELVGSGEIPELFPGIIDEGLKSGGIDWPELPGLTEIINQAQDKSATPTLEQEPPNTPEASNAAKPTPKTEGSEEFETLPQISETSSIQKISNLEQTETPKEGIETSTADPYSNSSLSISFDDEITFSDRFRQDLAANSLAVVVLIGMVISIIWILTSIIRIKPTKGVDWSWLLPILSVLGIVVAGYLSFVEVTETEAVCGPVGDCNSVQQSPYAILFGFLPVGVLGLLGYLGILIGWIFKQFGPESLRDSLTILIWGMALFGVVFSIYLTFLEPFVIGATCMWCISSAIIITIQFWSATEPVRRLWMDSEDEFEE